MPTGRIDINGQGSICATEMTVSRSMPPVLAERMLFTEWTMFCDRIDEALLPATKAKNCSLIFILLWLSLCIGIVIFSFVALKKEVAFILMFVAVAGTFVGVIIVMCRATKAGSDAEKDMSKVFEDYSATLSGISFGFAEARYTSGMLSAKVKYIEVSISEGYVAPSEPLSAITETESEEAGSKNNPPSERMSDHEQMEALLTDDVFQRKIDEVL